MTSSIRTATAVLLFSACSLFGAELLPLQSGNSWTYREKTTGQEFTVRVGTPVVMDDRVYYSVSGYVEQRLFVRANESGDLVYLDEETGAEQLLTSFAPFEGGWWQAPFRQCDQEGQTLEKRGVHNSDAGRIEQVLEVRFRSFGCADAGVQSEQYAENIGMLRRVIGSIAGPREFNLVYARVGKRVLEALPYGRFTVSVAAGADSDVLTATLRLQTSSPVSLSLQFPSAQEYDLVLKDEAGLVVWKWSDGQVFAEGSHERLVGTEWPVKVEVPRPALDRNYTLQAWLTTAGDVPRFAASTPLPKPARAEE